MHLNNKTPRGTIPGGDLLEVWGFICAASLVEWASYTQKVIWDIEIKILIYCLSQIIDCDTYFL